MSGETRFISSEGTMPTRLLLILLLLVLIFPASLSWAAAPGPYLEIEGYGAWMSDSKNQTDTGTFNTAYAGGTGWGVALGYDLADAHPALGHGRVELEAASRRNSVKKLSFAEGSLSASGAVKVKSLMANTIVEHHDQTRWVPYLALGAGYAEVSIDRVQTAGTDFIDAGTADVFAYQLGAGVGFELGDHLTLDVGYRYFATLKPKLKLADGSSFKMDLASHNLLVGLRLKY
jgi:outer membrane immunogenic protein